MPAPCIRARLEPRYGDDFIYHPTREALVGFLEPHSPFWTVLQVADLEDSPVKRGMLIVRYNSVLFTVKFAIANRLSNSALTNASS